MAQGAVGAEGEQLQVLVAAHCARQAVQRPAVVQVIGTAGTADLPPHRDAIEAHLAVVFTALAVAREAQHRTGLAIGDLVRQLRPLHSATIAINGAQQTFNPEIAPRHQQILDALNQPGGTH